MRTANNRNTFVLVMVLGVLAIVGGPSGSAQADCFSQCSRSYYTCLRGYSERDCATTRSKCSLHCSIAAERRYGSIAYSQETGSWGSANKQKSQTAAEQIARANCAANGGRNCAIELWFFDQCGALAKGDKGAYATARHRTRKVAQVLALDYCRQVSKSPCRIELSICAR